MKKGLFGLILLLSGAINAGDITDLNLRSVPNLQEILNDMLSQERDDIVITEDGKFLVVGHMTDSKGNNHMAVKKYNSDGTLDVTFGTGGITIVNTGGESQAESIELMPEGKFLIKGYGINDQNEEVSLTAMLMPYGLVDNTFNPDSSRPGVSIEKKAGSLTKSAAKLGAAATQD